MNHKDLDQDFKQVTRLNKQGTNQQAKNSKQAADKSKNSHVYSRLYNDNKRKAENLELKSYIHKEDLEIQSKPKINK